MIHFRNLISLLAFFILLPTTALPQTKADDKNWYEQSFYMFLLDYHTRGDAEVGKDASLTETIDLLKISRPDVVMVHAKGNPGWTSYPSKIGHTPPKLANDMMQLWKDAAKSLDCHFSAYYNLGRDAEIMKRKPEWNRLKANGKLADRALCYNSGVVEEYLLPMIGEIMEKYSPDGFWFDGSCFTVENCYCTHCRERFRKINGLEAPLAPDEKGWDGYKEMHRQIYRETLEKVARYIKIRDPYCLVAVNLAYGIHMPEKAPDYLDYLTCDMGNEIDNIPHQVIWFDGQEKPFDLMTTNYFNNNGKLMPKPKEQLEQELAIIIANGGKYWAWDNPTSTAKLSPERFRLLGEVVSPFLRSRQEWCTQSNRLADVSLFQGAASHYAFTRNSPVVFLKKNNAVFGAGYALRKLHLNYEVVSDDKLSKQKINGKLLIVENPLALTEKNIEDFRKYTEEGGTLLLTGLALKDPRLSELSGVQLSSDSVQYEKGLNIPLMKSSTAKNILQEKGKNGKNLLIMARNNIGKGTVYSLPVALFPKSSEKKEYPALGYKILKTILPDTERLVTTSASPDVELYLREQSGQKVLHLVNMAEGERTNSDYSNWNLNACIRNIPPVPKQKISIKLDKEPTTITLQPQKEKITDWYYFNGRLEFYVSSFDIHQIVEIK